MNFEVHGRDEVLGTTVKVRLRAADEAAVREKAKQLGLSVLDVSPVGSQDRRIARTRRAWTLLLVCLVVSAGLIAYTGIRHRENPLWRRSTPAISNYEVLNTVRYDGGTGAFCLQAAGVLTVARERRNAGEVAYKYTFDSKSQAPMHAGEGRVTFPPIEIYRDPATERFTGGESLLKNLAIVSNHALDQVKAKLVVDGAIQFRKFDLQRVSNFPSHLSYSVVAKSQKLKSAGATVLILAMSDPFEYSFPDGNTSNAILAEHRMLLLTDKAMDRVVFSISRFVARPRGAPATSLSIEYVMHELVDGQPLSIAGMESFFDTWLAGLGLETKPAMTTNVGLPDWAMHSLAVRDQAELVAGAAIEGKPNFVITATIGTILLIDSGVSVGTKLLHETGVIDWEWKGIPNYAGGGLGLMAAKGFSAITAQPVDESRWRAAGGIVGDVGALFLPSSVTGAGVKFTLGGSEVGMEIVKTGSLAGKAIRISENGVELVKAQKGWLASEAISGSLLKAKKLIGVVKAGYASIDFAKATTSPLKAKELVLDLGNKVTLKLVQIPGGKFTMGSPEAEQRAAFKEVVADFETDATDSFKDKPNPFKDEVQHEVTISKPFYMGVTAVTQEQYEAVMGDNPGLLRSKGARNPVEMVQWDDAVEFCKKLSVRTGRTVSLPTEAQWEYACRAGTKTRFYFGDSYADLGDDHAWYRNNSEDKIHPVGQKKPNAWGLYDMHGNVWQWCADWYGEYPKDPVKDPIGPNEGRVRVLRGGSWGSHPLLCRSAFRYRWGEPRSRCDSRGDGFGFRVAVASADVDRPMELSLRVAVHSLDPVVPVARDILRDRGPNGTIVRSDARVCWFEIHPVGRAIFEPETHETHGYVTQEHGGRRYMLLSDAPTSKLTRDVPGWRLINVDLTSNREVTCKFNADGTRLFFDLTRRNIGRQLAILVDDRVIIAPCINAPISGGSFVFIFLEGTARAELDWIVDSLRSGIPRR